MDRRETERFMARMAEMQPRAPEWCKAEQLEIRMPQRELWRYGTNDHGNMLYRIIKQIFGRQELREVSP